MVSAAEDYDWSSAEHHVKEKPDSLIKNPSWLKPVDRESYKQFLKEDDKRIAKIIEQATRNGRPI